MKPVTREMIHTYKINKLKYDFMGYTFDNTNQLSFHHLVIPKRECREMGLGDGYLIWNGAILRQNTSHDYLHLIERIDREIFLEITQCMIRENKLGMLTKEELINIRNLLLYFENEHKMDVDREGRKLIKRKFITERIDL